MANELQGTSQLRGTYNAVASEAIAANLLVEDHTVAGQLSLCPASGCPSGIAYYAIASGAAGDVYVFVPGDVVKAVSSATIAIGDYVKPAASGQVAPEATATTRTEFTIGVALSAVTDSGAFYFRVTV
jgi:hypothetical protein